VATEEAETVPVRTAAVAALGSAGAQARSTLWGLVRDAEVPPAVRHAAIRALARVSPDGASDVGALAADGKRPFAERLLAVQALAQPTAPGSAVLARLATSVTPTIRAAALSALAERGDTTQAALMASALSDPWATVRLRGLQGLRALGAGATYRTQVIGRLLDTDPRVLSLAAQLVGATCRDIASQVTPSLKLLLASGNFRVRYDAALALFALGDTSGAATMLADQASPNPTQQRMAGMAYAQITAVKT
jgi:HEAT repeat protein